MGICLDGDADRVMILDEHGQVADGDQLMALLAARWAETGRLKGGALVATVMSNLGFRKALNGLGIYSDELIDRGIDFLFFPSADAQVAPLTGQCLGNGATHAPRTAGYQCSLAF